MSLVEDSLAIEARLGEIVGWRTCARDDSRVARVLYQERVLDRIHSLDRVSFFDEFFAYLKQVGVWELLESLDPGVRDRPLIPFLKFVLVTLMRSVSGIGSQLATQDLLLTDEGLMGLLGFNGAQVREGCNRRGLDRQKEPVEVRGVFSFETVADNLVTIPPEKLEALFNGAIRCLARQRCFGEEVHAVLDTTDLEATPTYQTEDGGEVPKILREKRPDVRANRHAKKVETWVYGWKAWVVWDPGTQLPLALVVDRIDVHENQRALRVVEQANANLEGASRIVSLALDRGFLDGKLLTELEKLVPWIYIPAQKSMDVAKDARALARMTRDQIEATGSAPDNCTLRERQIEVRKGSGKRATREVLTTTLVGIRDLACDWWNPEGSLAQKGRNSKRRKPPTIHATVVLRWDGAPRGAEKEVVFLSNDSRVPEDPFVAFDEYDRRSTIENTCFREAKEKWHLEKHPKRSEAGVRVHTCFTFLCMGLVRAFRAHKAEAQEQAKQGRVLGIERYRRELLKENLDKVMVFVGERYGIFRTYEIALFAGWRVLEQEEAGITRETVLARYGITPSRSDTS